MLITDEKDRHHLREAMQRRKDAEEFRLYVQACTDRQVLEVMRKEQAAGRTHYAVIAQREADARKLEY